MHTWTFEEAIKEAKKYQHIVPNSEPGRKRLTPRAEFLKGSPKAWRWLIMNAPHKTKRANREETHQSTKPKITAAQWKEFEETLPLTLVPWTLKTALKSWEEQGKSCKTPAYTWLAHNGHLDKMRKL